jgi:hypothetical protein
MPAARLKNSVPRWPVVPLLYAPRAVFAALMLLDGFYRTGKMRLLQASSAVAFAAFLLRPDGALVVLLSVGTALLRRPRRAWQPAVAAALVVMPLIFAGLGLGTDYLLSRNYQKLKETGNSTDWNKTGGGFWGPGGFGGGSGGGGGFGGFGGGGSGGGGAGGGW